MANVHSISFQADISEQIRRLYFSYVTNEVPKKKQKNKSNLYFIEFGKLNKQSKCLDILNSLTKMMTFLFDIFFESFSNIEVSKWEL